MSATHPSPGSPEIPLRLARNPRKTASLRGAINAFCRSCIYDPGAVDGRPYFVCDAHQLCWLVTSGGCSDRSGYTIVEPEIIPTEPRARHSPRESIRPEVE